VASLGEVAESVSAACARASKCKDALASAQGLAEDAQTLFAIALEGDTTGDKDKILTNFAEVVTGVNDLWKALDKGMSIADAVLVRLRGHPPPPPAMPSPAPQRPAPSSPTSAGPAPLSSEKVEELRRELPPPFGRNTGRKTHGRWITPDGSTQQEISGQDEWTPKVNDALRAAGCPTLPVATSADVELKLAARMREQGATDPTMRHVDVVLNRRPCEGPLGCDKLLPVVLPEGYTLAVYGPDGYYEKFSGGKSPWRR
jgi:hypothetical protein